MNELGTLATSAVISLLGGGGLGAVLGAAAGRKTAKDQLALDTRKHEDALASPKRTHQLTELQQSAVALETAIKFLKMSAGSSWSTYEHQLDQLRGSVAAGYPAVAAYAGNVTRGVYQSAQEILDDDQAVQSNPKRVVEVLQMALGNVHDVIQNL
jgi:hypothetical protein